MASLSAVRSPSQQQTSTSFLVSSSPSSIPAHHLHHLHHHHHHHEGSPVAGVDNGRILGNVSGIIASCPYRRSSRGKVLHYEPDFSSPTSWEFRDNGCPLFPPTSLSLPVGQMPVSILPSSSASSASTPSPMDEGPYQVQMHLSLLRPPSSAATIGVSNGALDTSSRHSTPNHLHNSRHHTCNSSTMASHSPIPPSLSSSVAAQQQQQSILNSTNNNSCPCASAVNCNSTMVIMNREPDLSGNGSDGSRNSTGSHRSQDSGFSDSGETKRTSGRKCGGSGGGGSNDTFDPSSVQHHFSHVLTGSVHQNSNGNCNGNISLENGNGYHQHECTEALHHLLHSDSNGNGNNRSGTNCCERPASQLVQNGYSSYAQVYDSIPMPSPIPPSGFGCGRLVTPGPKTDSNRSTPTPTLFISNGSCGGHGQHRQQQHAEFTSFTVATPPVRPASVDISSLDRGGNCNGGISVVPIRMSPSPPPTTCTNCLSSAAIVQDPYQTSLRRSFSPQRTSSPHRDIALLASSSTATAVAALRVPLSSSTPKRQSASSSRLLGTNGMVKIDNFESLNKNVNKDNNNNSSNSGSASGTPGKSVSNNNNNNNKTFTVQPLRHAKDSRSVNNTNCFPNGTVLAEGERVESASHQESAPATVKLANGLVASSSRKQTRTAAESIYDKICSRLSSFSSSSSFSVSNTPSSSTTSAHQTQIQQRSCNSTASTGVNSTPSTNSTTDNQTVLFQKQSPPPPPPKVDAICEDDANIAPCYNLSSIRNDIVNNTRSSKDIRESHELTSSHNSSVGVGEQFSTGCQQNNYTSFARSSSSKWQSLPRGLGNKRLSLLDDAGNMQKEATVVDYPVDVPKPSTSKTIILPSSTNENICANQRASKCKAASGQSWKAVEEKAESEVVKLWLHDLRTQTEPECLHSLQTKWILPAEVCHGDEEDEEGTISRSISPATTVTSSVTTATSGIISSSSCPQHSDDTVKSYPESSLGDNEHYRRRPPHHLQNHRKISTSSSASSYVNKQQQRRSQQKFLSSMTAAIHAVSTPLMSIRNVEMTANIISGEFSKICKHLEFGIFTQVPTLVLSLVGHIEDFLRTFHNSIGFGNLKKLESRLENACYTLHMAAKSMSEAALMISSSSDSGQMSNGSSSSRTGSSSSSNGSHHHHHHPRSSSSSSSTTSSPDCLPSSSSSGDPFSQSSCLSSDEQGPESMGREYHVVVNEVVEGIVTVGNLFSQVVDLRLTRDLACILDTIEGGGIPARIALKSLVTVLADGGNHICRLAADIRTVRGLLGVLLDTREDQDKILALRCLATVLCVGEAVKDFDKAGGFEIIADLLYEPSYPMWMKIEAVAVLTQATDPWIDLETTLLTLGVHLEKFIVSLTNLTREFKTAEEPFLLIVAAISNLTFLEVAATEYLKKCRTVSFLIDAVKATPTFSVFVLDHVATILANMAGVDSCRQEIIQCGGVNALLEFLQQRPSAETDSVSAITACERLQQKSTIALSRLCNEDGVARYVFDMGGVNRLVTLCRKEKERNYSDGVLIAALATLRKLVTTCGEDVVQGLGAEDLIEPRLLDSFLLYSSRQESYV